MRATRTRAYRFLPLSPGASALPHTPSLPASAGFLRFCCRLLRGGDARRRGEARRRRQSGSREEGQPKGATQRAGPSRRARGARRASQAARASHASPQRGDPT